MKMHVYISIFSTCRNNYFQLFMGHQKDYKEKILIQEISLHDDNNDKSKLFPFYICKNSSHDESYVTSNRINHECASKQEVELPPH